MIKLLSRKPTALRKFSAFHDETGRLNVDGMNIISNDGSNKLNRSRKARVSYKVQRTINASLNAATSTRAVSSNPNFVTRQKILLSLLLPSLLIMFIPSTFKRPVSSWKALNLRKTLLMASSVRLKPLNCSRLPCVYAQETLTFLLTQKKTCVKNYVQKE